MRNWLKYSVPAVALSLALAASAKADSPVYVTNPNLPVTVTNFAAVQSLVVQALQELSSQNTTNTTTLGKLQTNLADVQDQAQVKYGIETARVHALMGAQSGSADCNFLEGASGFSGYAAQVAQWREQLISTNLDWTGNAPTINGQPNPSAVSSQAALSRLTAATCSNGFASAAAIAAGACGTGVTAGPNAGIVTNIGGLLDSGTMSPAQSTAAQLYVNRAVTPEPLSPMVPSDVTSGAGASIIAQRDALLSRVGAATWTIGGAMSRRQAWVQGPPGLEQWANGTAADMPGHFTQTNGSYFPNGVSEMDYMRIRADSWVFDQKFLQASSATTDPSVSLKDLVRIESSMAWMQWKSYQLQEQNNILLALLLSNSQYPTSGIGNR